MVKVRVVLLPALLVVAPAVMVAALPPTVTVRAWLAMKPLAVRVTPVVPTGPLVGLSPVAVWVTVNGVGEVALFVPSDTTMAFAPCAEDGMMMVIVLEPLAALVPPAVIAAKVPPTLTVRAWLAMKPLAVMVTPVVPTGPLVGLSPVAVWVTVKGVPEVALLVPSETTTAWAPWGAAGMVKVTVALPVALVVPPAVIVAAVPPTVTVRAWLAVKPLALMVTPVVPTAPVVGLSPVAVAVTVNGVAEVALPVPSETTTGWLPAGRAGMVKVTVALPWRWWCRRR